MSHKLLKAQNNSKKQCQVIQEIIGKKRKKSRKITEILNKNGKITRCPLDIMESFNTYFTSIGPELVKKIKPSDVSTYNHIVPNSHSIYFYDTTPLK